MEDYSQIVPKYSVNWIQEYNLMRFQYRPQVSVC